MPLCRPKRRTVTFRFGDDDRILVYLQNSGEWNGVDYSSVVLSCNATSDEMESIVTRATNYVNRSYPNYPIRWKDAMNGSIFLYDSVEGDRIGSALREKCFLVDDVHFHGGYIGGGKTGDKVVTPVEFRENHLPMKVGKKSPILMAVCNFNGRHDCTVGFRNGTLSDIRQYQDIITGTFIQREHTRWTEAPNQKKDVILQSLRKISINCGGRS